VSGPKSEIEHLRRIALVTRHYGALRSGVMHAIIASCLIIGLGIELLSEAVLPRGSWRLTLGLLNIFGSAAVVLLLWFLANRWMDRRFGRVRSTSVMYLLRKTWLLNLCMFVFLAASRFDDAYGVGTGLPSFRFLVAAAYGLWVCVSRWQLALHYLLPTASALAFALTHGSLQDPAAFETWELKAYFVTLLAWTAAGLIDFALLVRVLPDHRPDQVHGWRPTRDDAL
jgi:hypothetical protein